MFNVGSTVIYRDSEVLVLIINPTELLDKPVNTQYTTQTLYRKKSAGYWIDSKGKFVSTKDLPQDLRNRILTA